MAKKKNREIYQQDLFSFDEETKFKIPSNSQVCLCEFFAGVGFTRMGISRVFPNLKSHHIVEWAVPSIIAYDSVHNSEETFNDHTCCENMSKDEIAEKLFNLGISLDYDEPANLKQIQRLKEDKLRQIYSSITHTHNLVNIMNVKGEDLEITDTDHNFFIWTWTFPCQDISGAGQGKGFSESQANNESQSLDGNGTRSGLCWEFIRILKELKEIGKGMPQCLIMENVPLIHSADNNTDFLKIQNELEKLGYNNKWQDLLGTDYKVAQNRDRTFMVSIYDPNKKYTYSFPHPIKLKKRLKDFLEDKVDEKYYLNDKAIEKISNWKSRERPIDNAIDVENDKDEVMSTLTARGAGEEHSGMKLIMVRNHELDEAIVKKEKNEKYNECSINHIKGNIVETDSVANCITTNSQFTANGVNVIKVRNATKKGYLEAEEGDGIDCSTRMEKHRGTVQKGISQTITTQPDIGRCVKDGETFKLRIRKLTPKECMRLQGCLDDSAYEKMKNVAHLSDREIYHIAGDGLIANIPELIVKEMVD